MNIPLFKIYWNESDIENIASIIRSGKYWAIGPKIREFEKRVADYVGVEYAHATNSGTSALHALMLAHNIGEGDEVIVPSFTFIATANAPLFVGAKPVFADIEEGTYGLDTSDVERKITPRTKAIIPIHYGGSPCQIIKLQKLAERYNLLLIEDAAESLGASVNGQKVGSFGDSAILSFCSPKVITTGEGGMMLTSSKDIYEKVKLICNQGRAETSNYFSTTEQMQYVSLGYNFRMSTITAALGLSQMDKLEDIIFHRRFNANYLSKKLSEIEEIEVPFTLPNYSQPNYFQVYQMFTIRVRDSRNELKEYLNKQGIGAKVYFEPVHKSLFYKRLGYHIELPVTEKVCNEVLTLPMYPELSLEEMDYMADKIKEFFV